MAGDADRPEEPDAERRATQDDSAPEVRVRPAVPPDVPAVLPMIAALCALHEAWDPERYPMLPDVVDRYKQWLPARATDPRSVFLVAEIGGAVVGFLVAGIEKNIPIYRLEQFAFIHDVWVEPDFRGRGIAGALVDEAARRLKLKGVAQVRLETAAVNEEARRVFASRGFRVGTIDMLRQL